MWRLTSRLVVVLVAISPAATATTASADQADRLTLARSCDDVVSTWRNGSLKYLYQPYASNLRDPALQMDPLYPPPTPTPRPNPNGSTGSGYEELDDVVPEVDDSGVADGTSSDTNVQDQAVAEPDYVKHDGRYLYVVGGQELRVVTANERTPRLVGRLTLDLAGGTILRQGSRLLVIGRKPPKPPMEHSGGGVVPEYDEDEGDPSSDSTARLLEIDVSSPRSPRLLRTLDVPGQVLASRQIDSTARVVVRTAKTDYHGSYKQRRWRLRHTTIRQIVPSTTLRSAITGARYRRPLADCTSIARPAELSGHQLLAVLTIDLERGLVGLDRDAVLGTPQVAYASRSSLFVGNAHIADPEQRRDRTVTRIHAFDTSVPGRTTYAASGHVEGLPVNQYAFSEDRGVLRVATTANPRWWYGTLSLHTDNRLTTLRRYGSSLAPLGVVAGFGRGEEIKSVRFAGDRAYVVTFRNTDPLFTLDLSVPSAPSVLGEVKVPGYSGYLHVLGDDLVLGLGQNGDAEGADRGAQVSLFDASDPARPVRIAHRSLGGRGSSVELDPHAFLWWPKRRMALVSYSDWGRRDGFVGSMVALRPSATAQTRLRELGRVRHGKKGERVAVLRAIVIGDRLLSVSSQGVLASRVSDLRPTGYHRFDSRGFKPLRPIAPAPTPATAAPTTP